ncbi:nitrilase-related carbon-nitrogen hydrolase [Pseudokineococcus lusitanus]|uniref:Putative amidohydrolase n=1 Tax=Pseudokineococcus lusitanus TaxID=763993 RepID=A0A3N1HJY1_9ACTN|nr:nitrilase-related carbon-nitrogen hydrolase [Pseudokineococcus lusitanus]ROP42819.1 putative amidohydrolase [Pseudokineococcus lusitanus]
MSHVVVTRDEPARPPARVAALQLAPVLGDLAGNTERSTAAVSAALAAGVDLVVLPELVTSGYLMADADEARSLAVTAGSSVLTGWADACRARPGAVVVGGFCELGEDGAVHNSAAVVDASGVRAVYRKVHLWGGERRLFTPGGAAPTVVETAHGRVAALICYDLGFPEWPRAAALAGADLIAVPTNWERGPRPAGERPIGQVAAMGAARANHVAVVCADRTGTELGVEWTEGSAVVSAEGWVVSEPVVGEGTAWADVDLHASRDRAPGRPGHFWNDRRPDLYGSVVAPLVDLLPVPRVEMGAAGAADALDVPGAALPGL